MTDPRTYAQEHAETFRSQLYELIRIPSVSTEPDLAGEVRHAADWIADELKRIGAEHVAVMPTAGHPVVYGDWLKAEPGAPTVLVYGHYDVQPASMSDGWHTDPFEPTERDGFIYARGSSDDKGQMFIHIKALESFLATQGSAPVNLKFLFEGEEEIGSKNLLPFLQANRELLKSDVCVISDTGMRDIRQPSLTYALRGLTYMQIDVTGAARDLHSGGYGGVVHNPALALAQIIARLHNPDNSIAVPGFYDDVLPLSPEERAELAKQDITEEKLIAETNVPASWGEEGYSLRERVGARPTMEINGLLSGWTGAGSKTVLPATAMAKVSCRLVANQNPHRIYELVRDYVASIAPPTVKVVVSLINTGDPAIVDIHSPYVKAAVSAYERGWGAAPNYAREGGSIPVVADFKRELGIDSVLLGFGLNTDGAHGPNEHFSIEMFHLGIDTAICFYEDLRG
ncbi:MAG: dipeptidase [Chloroflexi bacterium]|nr:dipeptidase [Chloroflexota bacterium]